MKTATRGVYGVTVHTTNPVNPVLILRALYDIFTTS